MSSHYLDFSSCGIVPGFCKSGHIFYWLIIGFMLDYSPLFPHYSGIILEYQAASKFPKLFPHNSLRPSYLYVQFHFCN